MRNIPQEHNQMNENEFYHCKKVKMNSLLNVMLA